MSQQQESVIFRGISSRLPRRPVVEFANELREKVAGGREFVCLVTTDRELRDLNRRFLSKDYVTDVLSFPQRPSNGLLGEMAISAQRAAAQARDYGHSTLEEIRILMLHGLLHLLGMDHEADGGRMRRMETRWRKKLNLPAGLIERVTR